MFVNYSFQSYIRRFLAYRRFIRLKAQKQRERNYAAIIIQVSYLIHFMRRILRKICIISRLLQAVCNVQLQSLLPANFF